MLAAQAVLRPHQGRCVDAGQDAGRAAVGGDMPDGRAFRRLDVGLGGWDRHAESTPIRRPDRSGIELVLAARVDRGVGQDLLLLAILNVGQADLARRDNRHSPPIR